MAAALYEDGARRDVRIRFSDAGRDFFKVVFRSHMDFYKILGMLRAKRRAIQRDRTGSAAGNIYRGSIILRHALGRRTFGRMM